MKAGSGYPSSSRFRLRPSQAFAALAAVLVPGGEASATDRAPDFTREILPILSDNCFYCHGDEEKHEENLDLRLVRFILTGGDCGAAVVADLK